MNADLSNWKAIQIPNGIPKDAVALLLYIYLGDHIPIPYMARFSSSPTLCTFWQEICISKYVNISKASFDPDATMILFIKEEGRFYWMPDENHPSWIPKIAIKGWISQDKVYESVAVILNEEIQ